MVGKPFRRPETCFSMDMLLMSISRITQSLQPLDRSFFKPLKQYFKEEASKWIPHHPGRTISRMQVDDLIGRTWNKAASVYTAVNGFRKTGMFPLDQDAIPGHLATK
ncbi:hypothetical protein PR048_001897 [Dryococelus australis]|uniref:Uncharacterized protein n=1 Tax=Dryococelus australis TaxID=614101 RepID=A0ABQ9IIN8_9NEOP|nr:hypothetical protein PR048_001897 [Dryococelus australis]